MRQILAESVLNLSKMLIHVKEIRPSDKPTLDGQWCHVVHSKAWAPRFAGLIKIVGKSDTSDERPAASEEKFKV
jgi:hypothetical protein